MVWIETRARCGMGLIQNGNLEGVALVMVGWTHSRRLWSSSLRERPLSQHSLLFRNSAVVESLTVRGLADLFTVYPFYSTLLLVHMVETRRGTVVART